MSATVFSLTSAGQPQVALVCPSGGGDPAGPEPLSFAADELATYLAIITGTSFPVTAEAPVPRIVLCVETADREQHGWRITPDEITLYGSDPGAVLHAVYHFLETHCGCRWLSPLEGEEVVPRQETLSVPCEESRFSPVFTHRAFTNYPRIDRDTVLMVDWMAKQRFSRFMIFANMAGSFEAYERLLRRELIARGLKVEMGHHSFRYFLPPEEFFAEHPEYYALLEGERSERGQVCTANPAVAEVMAQRLCAFLSAHPEIDTVGLWPNDGYGWCECPACLAQEPQEPSWPYAEHPRRTDTYLKFVNRVAEAVAREHPDRRLSALAYVNYVQPPREVVPLPNVKVCFAPFQRCFKHSVHERVEGRCRRPNAQYARLLEQWRALVPGELYLFEYLMLIDMCSVPYGLTSLLPEDLQHYAALGVDGYVLEFKPEEWGTYGVNAHLIGRLSWDLESNLDCHYEDLFGAAALEVRAYFARLATDFVQPGGCVHHYDLEYTRRATPLLLRSALEHLGRAVAAAAREGRWPRENVRRAQVGAQLLLRLGHWREALAQAKAAGPHTRERRVAEALQAGEELSRWVDSKARSGALDAPYLQGRIESEKRALSGS